MFLVDLSEYHIPLVIMLGLLGSFVIFLICAIVQSYYGNQERKKEMKFRTLDVCEFYFDFNNKEVTYFKRFDSTSMTKEKISVFYKRILDPRKLTMFKDWLNDLNKGVERVLQSEIEISFDNDEMISFYFYQNLESNTPNVVHLEATQIINQDQEVATSNKKGISVGTAFLRKYKNSGYMVYLRIFPCNKDIAPEKPVIALKEVTHIFQSFYNESNLRVRLNASHNEYILGLIDYTDATPDEYGLIMENFSKKIEGRLELLNFQNDMNYCIAVGKCEEYQEPYELLSTLKHLTYYSTNAVNHIEWYFRSEGITIEKTIEARKELEQILNGKSKNASNKVVSLFSPLIDMDSCRLFGFYSHTITNTSIFKSMNELFKTSEEFDLSKDVCITLMKRILFKYYTQYVRTHVSRGFKNNNRLFLQLSPYDVKYLFDFVDDIRYIKSCNIVFIIGEDLLNDMVKKDINEAFRFLQSLKDRNFELCFRVKDRALPWPNGIYEKFDYYLADKNLHSGKEHLDSSTSLKAVFNKLEVFEKPFIAIDVESRTEFKILSEKNVKIFSGDYFAKDSQDIVMPNLIKIGKLKK